MDEIIKANHTSHVYEGHEIIVRRISSS